MEIEIDYNPTPSKTFFISVSLNNKEAISFDYTTKAQRVIKQVLVDRKRFPNHAQIDGEWDALIFKDRKFIKKYHVRWIDLGKKDWCNEEIWEVAWAKPIPDYQKRKLLSYSKLFSDNYKNIKEFSKEFKKFEDLLKKEISKIK